MFFKKGNLFLFVFLVFVILNFNLLTCRLTKRAEYNQEVEDRTNQIRTFVRGLPANDTLNVPGPLNGTVVNLDYSLDLEEQAYNEAIECKMQTNCYYSCLTYAIPADVPIVPDNLVSNAFNLWSLEYNNTIITEVSASCVDISLPCHNFTAIVYYDSHFIGCGLTWCQSLETPSGDFILQGFYFLCKFSEERTDQNAPPYTPGFVVPSATPTITATSSPSVSISRSVTSSISRSRTASVTASKTASRTPSKTASPTPSRTASVTASPSSSRTASVTASRTASITASVTATRTASRTITATKSRTATRTRTRTRTRTASVTASRTATKTVYPAVFVSPSVAPVVILDVFGRAIDNSLARYNLAYSFSQGTQTSWTIRTREFENNFFSNWRTLAEGITSSTYTAVDRAVRRQFQVIAILSPTVSYSSQLIWSNVTSTSA
eukprot:TRINITY_DN202_c0_g2_i1.p2 TRINITY_DN202_c0_g2~~TRINITY_DN202_c0_g2_i1.p2  ORF type:complete len:437 (-),score=205.10 TRINITY_DN202_c0_g2_i1:1622-2932(-)